MLHRAVDGEGVGPARERVLPVTFARIPVGQFVTRFGDQRLDRDSTGCCCRSRIDCIRASGAKSLPLTMPIAAR
jgi:hypothetical protein